jgi:hypothetical protein
MVQILQLFAMLELSLVSMLKENKGCFHPHPLDLFVTHSQLLEGLKCESQTENIGRVEARFLVRNIIKG